MTTVTVRIQAVEVMTKCKIYLNCTKLFSKTEFILLKKLKVPKPMNTYHGQ